MQTKPKDQYTTYNVSGRGIVRIYVNALIFFNEFHHSCVFPRFKSIQSYPRTIKRTNFEALLGNNDT